MASKRKSAGKFSFIGILVVIGIIIGIVSTLSDKFGSDDSGNSNPIDYGSFSVHFIDVGQGDCSLIKTDKGNMLIDAGENGNENYVLNYLKKHGVTELEYFVATHPHSDHIGGAAEVLDNIKVKNIIMPNISESNLPNTKTYENMLTSIKESGAKVIAAKPGKTYTFGDVSFTVLAPFEQDENLNNMSVALKLSCGEYSFMFTGDAEKEVEEQILNGGADLSADVFKLAHHGSSTSNTIEFLEAVSPEYAVISCSADNKYGHPHDETIDSLEKLGIDYYSTYKSGNIIFGIDESGLNVYTLEHDEENYENYY